ncbi:MAG: efflux RND transporter periplasmic adaptor subunit [Fibrobacteraceae bacterium]|nr:efflux RND transporter periplasmic adaptor subunit [Fibrobacteraceae bacterium]
MNFLVFFLFAAFALVGCSSEGGAPAPGKAAGGKGPGGKGPVRSIAVEGYIAESHEGAQFYSAMASLEPMDYVELSAATSGRLVNLYAKDGKSVKKGELLAKIDDADLRAQLKQAEATKSLAQQKESRIRALFEKDGATKEDLEAAEASLQSASASVELLLAQIAKTEVRAPFAGQLGFVNVSVGAWLGAGTPIATLSSVKKLKAKFAIPQRYATILKVGSSVTMNDAERGISATGKVKALDATISQSSRTRQIMAELDNSKGEFVAGGYVKVSMSLSTGSTKSITVPAEALTLDKDGAYLFVFNGDKAKIKRVVTGLRTPISVDVVSGLDEGDTVIVSGLISMRPGISVKLKEIRRGINYEVTE